MVSPDLIDVGTPRRKGVTEQWKHKVIPAKVRPLGARLNLSRSTIADSDSFGLCVDEFSTANWTDILFLRNRLGSVTLDC